MLVPSSLLYYLIERAKPLSGSVGRDGFARDRRADRGQVPVRLALYQGLLNGLHKHIGAVKIAVNSGVSQCEVHVRFGVIHRGFQVVHYVPDGVKCPLRLQTRSNHVIIFIFIIINSSSSSSSISSSSSSIKLNFGILITFVKGNINYMINRLKYSVHINYRPL